MTDLGPALLLAALSLAVLAYWTRWRHAYRLRPIVPVAAMKMSDSVADEVVRGLTQKGLAKWGILAVLALGGGLLTPQGRSLVSSLAPMLAVPGEAAGEEESGDEQWTRPEWLDTRVIDGVPQSQRVDALDYDMRARIVTRLRRLPIFEVGGGAVYGDSIGVDFQQANGMMWGSVRVAFDWTRFEEDSYRDEAADAVAERVREALR